MCTMGYIAGHRGAAEVDRLDPLNPPGGESPLLVDSKHIGEKMEEKKHG